MQLEDRPQAWKPSKRAKGYWPVCGFELGDGTRCQSRAAVREGGPCEHHAMLADSADVIAESSPTPAPGLSREAPSGPAFGKTPRVRLAEDATEAYESIRSAVFEALEADKPFSVKCPCGCGHRFQARGPDFQARLKAVELALSQGFGKPREDEQTPLKVTREAILAAYEEDPWAAYPAEVLDLVIAQAEVRSEAAARAKDARGPYTLARLLTELGLSREERLATVAEAFGLGPEWLDRMLDAIEKEKPGVVAA